MTFLLSESVRLYGPADLGRAEDLAGRTAIAVENARLYQELKDADHRKTRVPGDAGPRAAQPYWFRSRNAVHPAEASRRDRKSRTRMASWR